MVRFVNNVKTAALLAALFGLLVAVGSFWGPRGMLIAGIFAVVMNFGAFFASHRLAIAAMRGREVNEQNAPELYHMVRRLARRAELPMPKVYVCPQETPNAFATGRSPKHAAVAVTQGALRLLQGDELEGVIGHELAHIKNRDTLTSTIAATVGGLFSMMAQYALFFGGGRRDGGNPLAMFGVVILGAVGAAIIKAMISRSREYVADADGAAIAGSPNGLVRALEKLEAYGRRIPMQGVNPAMNNMFIVEPFLGKAMGRLFASHPPTAKRIAALRQAR